MAVKKNLAALFACLMALSVPTMVQAWTVGSVPADGVYKFTFGVNSAAEGFAVPASALYDVQGTGYYDDSANATFSYGFLGTTEDSYKNDVPVGSKVTDVRQIDGFSVVEGQYIVLSDTNDLNGASCVCGPAAADYLPANASPYEGRYPVRFAMRAEERAYYAVTCTVANASSTANADVTLYSERSHLHAHHMTLAPGETRTFAWSVELAPNFCKAYSDSYHDNAINVCVVGENAALASVTVVKQPQVAGTVRGEAVDNMNVGKSIWICTDSTGCDYPMAVPFFSLQNYGGVGAGLSRWAPADISICNQGEGGLATNSKTHRQSCLLKPGDYLYVEYGHNESGVTSYDYEAPINEHGKANPSFAKYRERAAKHLNPGETIPDVPASMPVKPYGVATLSQFAAVAECGGGETRMEHPVYSERLGMGFGLITWSADIPAGVAGDLKVDNLHDFGYVYLDGERIGILDRRHRGIKIKIPDSHKVRKLDILVEAMGRINSSSGMEDRKGLDGRVFVGKTEIKDWEYELEPIDPDGQENPPGNWRGTFAVDEIADTFVDMRAFNKGIVWVNGKNLGRYWKIGPQQTLYLPGCWLKKGQNEIVVREMLEPTGEPTVAFLDHPILDELHPEADFNIVKREHDKFVGGDEVASGAFPNTDAAQVVMLEKPVHGTFFTLQALSSYDAKDLASIAEFDFLGADGNPLTSVDMQISGVDSEEEVRDDGVAENAIDGQVEAYWLSSSRTLPHWIEFHVSDKTEIHGFRYTPRQGNGIGRIKDWKLHVR